MITPVKYKINTKSNISFDGYGKIASMTRYGFDEKTVDMIVAKTTEGGKNFTQALSEVFNKDVADLKEKLGASLKDAEEFYEVTFKTAKAETVSKFDDNAINLLKSNLKKIVSVTKLADKEGFVEKLPCKTIVIDQGDDYIDDVMEADNIVDNGSREIKKLVGRTISINNVDNRDLIVDASNCAVIRGSRIRSVRGVQSVVIENCRIFNEIFSEGKVTAIGIIAKLIRAGSVDFSSFQNTVGKVVAQKDIKSRQMLNAGFVKSKEGDIQILGLGNRVKTAIANEDLYIYDNRGDLAVSKNSLILGADNDIKEFFATAKIKQTNVISDKIVSENGDVEIDGIKNEVKEINAGQNAYLENITAENVTAQAGEAVISGDDNAIAETIRAGKTVRAENLLVKNVICDKFIKKRGVHVLGKIFEMQA